jgi:hypothetical protein
MKLSGCKWLPGLGGRISNFPREIAETAMSHVIGDKAEQA